MSKYESDPLKQLRNRFYQADPLKIVIGSGDLMHTPEWICTNVEELDSTCATDWGFLCKGTGSIDNIFAEHVLEHLTEDQVIETAKNAFAFLKTGGVFRIAVPDGYFPSREYIASVRPGGSGAGATDHKVLWNYDSLSRVLLDAGFYVDLLEYWDGSGNFNEKLWIPQHGNVLRSAANDDRNRYFDGGRQLNYTSLIIDAIKK